MVIYDRYDIVFQEIPNEVSLAFTLKGCPNNCKGCHSPHLRELDGDELTNEYFVEIITKYRDSITTVLFLGGDRSHDRIKELSVLVKDFGLKIGLYSGLDSINTSLIPFLNYYKVGSYDKELGGLNSKNTNQRLLKINDSDIEDITHMFWR